MLADDMTPRSETKELYYSWQKQRRECQYLHYLSEPQFSPTYSGQGGKREGPKFREPEYSIGKYVCPFVPKGDTSSVFHAVCYTNICEKKSRTIVAKCLQLQGIQKCERPTENCYLILTAFCLSFSGLWGSCASHFNI